MIRGIGPVYAKRLLGAFGEKVFDVIEAEPDRLRSVNGIGAVRASRIVAAWDEQKVVREIMVSCTAMGSAPQGQCASSRPTALTPCRSWENPYRLARDIRGIGFKTADAIAMKLGIEKSAMIRVRAGISYALTEAMDEGHCGFLVARQSWRRSRRLGVSGNLDFRPCSEALKQLWDCRHKDQRTNQSAP
jgi:exodeoxyribonuclease V alpha subunit